MLQTALAVGAALVGLAFTLSTYDRWLSARKPHELAWTTAFGFFTLAAVALATGADAGWTTATFRAFYFLGAIADVPFLAVGTIYLLAGPTAGRRTSQIAVAFAAFSAGVMFTTPFIHPLPHRELAQGSQVFGSWPRVLAGLGSGVGATVVFAGAIWSALRRRHLRFTVSNLFIAAGTAVSGASGLLNSAFDQMTAFSITLTVGVSLIFLGFLIATSGSSGSRAKPGFARNRPDFMTT